VYVKRGYWGNVRIKDMNIKEIISALSIMDELLAVIQDKEQDAGTFVGEFFSKTLELMTEFDRKISKKRRGR